MHRKQHTGITSGELVLRALARYPERIAFAEDSRPLTYAATAELIRRYAKALKREGLHRGDRLASLSANRAEAFIASTAAQCLGLCVTPLHPMGSLEDHLSILDDAEIKGLVVDAGPYQDRGGELAARAERLEAVLTLGKAEYGRDLSAEAEQLSPDGFRIEAESGDYAALSYTGGTTGKPKGAVRRHHSAVAITTAVLADYEWPDEVRYLAATPISHVGGTKLLPTLLRGGSIHMMAGFDPERFLDTIERQRITATLLVPTMIYVLLDHPKMRTADLSSLEFVMYGAAPMSPTRLVEALEVFGPVFSQLYGQTECYPVSVLRKADHDPNDMQLLGSCGVPCSNTQVRLLDDALAEAPVGEPGEICVRAPQAVDEYWKRPQQTADTIQDGWLRTGDIARADERGYLYIVDRKKDMIVSGGFNVFPKEIEDVLTSHPSVAMAAVIGVPDEKWGEAVKALVVPRPGATVDEAALKALVRERKGAVYAPKSIDVVAEMPVTPIGKADKKAIRTRYWAGKERQVG